MPVKETLNMELSVEVQEIHLRPIAFEVHISSSVALFSKTNLSKYFMNGFI